MMMMKKMFGGGWRIVGLALSLFFFFFLDFLTTGTGDGQGAKVHKKNKNKYGRCAKVQPKKIWSVCQSSQKKIPKGAKVHKKKIPEVQNDHIATVDS